MRPLALGIGSILAAMAALGLSSCASRSAKRTHLESFQAGLRQKTRLDAAWLFHEGDISNTAGVISSRYDDAPWQKIHLPHDYVLSGDFSPANSRNHGYLPYRPAWYRKHFLIPDSDHGKILRLDFDGVFRDSQVWLNGQFLGRHASGYTPFSYDVTQVARCGSENELTVRVDPRAFEGWWYEGGGIYRHVYFSALAPLHVSQWGTYVVSHVPRGDQGAGEQANLTIHTCVTNHAPQT